MYQLPLLSDDVVKALKKSELTDEQLSEALEHYEQLYFLLEEQRKMVGNLYDLVWRDVRDMYEQLRGFKVQRQQKVN